MTHMRRHKYLLYNLKKYLFEIPIFHTLKIISPFLNLKNTINKRRWNSFVFLMKFVTSSWQFYLWNTTRYCPIYCSMGILTMRVRWRFGFDVRFRIEGLVWYPAKPVIFHKIKFIAFPCILYRIVVSITFRCNVRMATNGCHMKYIMDSFVVKWIQNVTLIHKQWPGIDIVLFTADF